jgi:glyoxylase-like metal-dependent hydrolase (beta-lactamase superfamily II)
MSCVQIPLGIRGTRRWFLVVSGAALAAPAFGRRGWAQATEAHRFAQGEIEVLVLSDGHLTLPASILAPSAPPEEFAALMTEIHGRVPETVMPATNVTLIRTGDDLVLVDNGSGNKFQPTAGKLFGNLAASGIEPGAVTKVVFSHAHPDHIWGTLGDDGALAFPNAAYYVGQAEWDHWTNPDLPGQMPEDYRPFALGAQRDLGAVKERVTMVRDGDAIARGVSVIDTPGHTPGHIALFVEGGDGLIVGADVAPNEIVSLRHPDWAFGFDADPETGIATRKALLDRAATDGTAYLGFHFAYPGVGRIERDGAAYRFVPA